MSGNLITALFELLSVVPRWLKLLYSFFREGKFLRILIGGVVRTGPQLALQLLLFFGLTLAANKLVLPAFRAEIVSRIGGLPGEWIQFLALCKIDQFITIMLSAFGIVAARKVRLRPVNPSLWS